MSESRRNQKEDKSMSKFKSKGFKKSKYQCFICHKIDHVFKGMITLRLQIKKKAESFDLIIIRLEKHIVSM